MAEQMGREAQIEEVGSSIHRLLRRRIEELPIPSHPAARFRKQEEFGLALLELSLGLRHVTRQSEHLTILDRSHMRRHVTLDVDLVALNERQRRAIAVTTREEENAGDVAWVPVARQARGNLAPVVVRDSSGAVVSRLTHHDTTRYITAALVRLFHMLLDAHPSSKRQNDPLYLLRNDWHNERWLIESAISYLVDDGSLDLDETTSKRDSLLNYPDVAQGGAFEGNNGQVRQRALKCIDSLFSAEDESFLDLIGWATREYPLVVLLSNLQSKCFLSFEAPLLKDEKHRKQLWPSKMSLRRAIAPYRLFTVKYTTTIPSSINSYHLTVETADEINVREFLLFTNSDDEFVTTLTRDLRALSDKIDAVKTPKGKGILTHELACVTSRLADLSRRRQIDLTRYQAHLSAPHKNYSELLREDENQGRLFASNLGDVPHPVAALARLRRDFLSVNPNERERGLPPNLDLRDTMIALSEDLGDLDMSWDATVDNDPRENGAHAHWRRTVACSNPRSTESIEVKAYLCLADDPPSLAGSVTRMLALLLGLTYCLGWFLSGEYGWFLRPSRELNTGTVDAVVTILLLVPGLLLARLELPRTSTVLGQLRLLYRVAAYIAVILTSLLAAYVSSRNKTGVPAWSMMAVLAGLLILLGYTVLSAYLQQRTVARVLPPSDVLPRWLRRELGGKGKGRGRLPDAEFGVVGGSRRARKPE